jgi:hypothetical protein
MVKAVDGRELNEHCRVRPLVRDDGPAHPDLRLYLTS